GLITSKVAPPTAPASSPSISSRSSPASTPVPPSASVVVMDAPLHRRGGGASRSGGLPLDRELLAGVEAGHLRQGAAEDRGAVGVGDGAVEVLGDGPVGAVGGAL